MPVSNSPALPFRLRAAVSKDVAALEDLIPLSVRGLQSAWYSTEQMEAALGPVFGVDRRLIHDGTYYVIEAGSEIVACGGWSRRQAAFGGDRHHEGQTRFLDPAVDAARIRAFFVRPGCERRGLGSLLLDACEAAIAQAGFHQIMMVATLAGEPLYAARGYVVTRRYEVPLKAGLVLPVVEMGKPVTETPEQSGS